MTPDNRARGVNGLVVTRGGCGIYCAPEALDRAFLGGASTSP
jgi:hypothetical protein